MACVNMFNAEQKGLHGGGSAAAAPPPIGPRISFSNDFVLDAATGCPAVRYERASPASAVSPSSDFEFSVKSHGMMTADELFFKGRLLPLQEHCTAAQMQRMTPRDELLAIADNEDNGINFSPSSGSFRFPGKVSLRWKTLLGLRKPYHSLPGKKQDLDQTKQLHREHADQEDDEEDAATSPIINTCISDDQQWKYEKCVSLPRISFLPVALTTGTEGTKCERTTCARDDSHVKSWLMRGVFFWEGIDYSAPYTLRRGESKRGRECFFLLYETHRRQAEKGVRRHVSAIFTDREGESGVAFPHRDISPSPMSLQLLQ